MFYKKEEEENWVTGNKISFPDGVTISVDNKIEKDGWKWYDTPPTEYTEWLESNEEDLV